MFWFRCSALDRLLPQNIDTDLYAPIKAGLEYFYPRLTTGGFLIMHDYMSLCWDGAIRAIDELFADKLEFIIPVTDVAGTGMMWKVRVERETSAKNMKGPDRACDPAYSYGDSTEVSGRRDKTLFFCHDRAPIAPIP